MSDAYWRGKYEVLERDYEHAKVALDAARHFAGEAEARIAELERRLEGCCIDQESGACSFDRLLRDCVEAAELAPLSEGLEYGGAGLRKGIRGLVERIAELEAELRGWTDLDTRGE